MPKFNVGDPVRAKRDGRVVKIHEVCDSAGYTYYTVEITLDAGYIRVPVWEDGLEEVKSEAEV